MLVSITQYFSEEDSKMVLAMIKIGFDTLFNTEV